MSNYVRDVPFLRGVVVKRGVVATHKILDVIEIDRLGR